MNVGDGKFLYERDATLNSKEAELGMPAMATAALVNRTHRVVHERATAVQARRSKARNLWIPMLIFSAMLLIFCSAAWSVLAEYDLVQTGIPDSGGQFMVMLLWFFPVTASLLAVVWFRRGNANSGKEVA